MPVGGARPGAGRPKGSINRNAKTLRVKAEKTGDLPADILLDVARYHHKRALELRASRMGPALATLDMQNEIRVEHAMAVSAADKAAGFYHPRLSPLPGDRPIIPGATTLEAMLLALTDLAANDDRLLEGPVIDGKADAVE